MKSYDPTLAFKEILSDLEKISEGKKIEKIPWEIVTFIWGIDTIRALIHISAQLKEISKILTKKEN